MQNTKFQLNRISKCRGQTVVETVCVLSVSLVLFVAALYTISFGVARLWLEHNLYESLVCELSSSRNCKSKFLSRIELLSWGRIQNFELSSVRHANDYKAAEAQLIWQHNWGGGAWANTNQIVLQMSLREKNLVGSLSSRF